MLDKSIPYKDIIMAADADTLAALKPPVLAEGYTLRAWRPGDENHWAALETSVAEFSTEESANAYFAQEFAPYADRLGERMFFTYGPDGTPASTATLWFDKQDTTQPMLHWVATHPAHQGKGLAGAVVRHCLTLAPRFYPGQRITLHTQTWSHPAIRLYQKLGFYPLKNPRYEGDKNQWAEAMEVLRAVYPAPLYEELLKSSR